MVHTHHGVVHQAKPWKVRVVFDCNAEYRGTSLNNQLISGPDLANQLVGVLTKFREEPVAFIADVETMFHQVRVTENQRRLDHEDHEMCVHLFGGISSSSTSIWWYFKFQQLCFETNFSR